MYPNSWINIFNLIKSGEKDRINLTEEETESNGETLRKNRGLSGYTVGLKYILNYYNNSNDPQSVLRNFAQKYINNISNNIVLPISPEQNYIFYFPYYISDNPRIENGSYPVAPIQDEADGHILTFPPNVTLVFDPGAFLKLGGTIFDKDFNISNDDNIPTGIVPSGDYVIDKNNINTNRLLLKFEEFLWIDIQGEVRAPKTQIFKVWDIEYVNFENHQNQEISEFLKKQIFWVKSLGVVQGPAKNNILYPEWWGAGASLNAESVHIGQSHVVVNELLKNIVIDRIDSNDIRHQKYRALEKFIKSSIRDIDLKPLTHDQLSIQSCVDASVENQEIRFTGDFVIHQVYLIPNRKYIGYGCSIRRPKNYNIQNIIQPLIENNINENYFDNMQKIYFINLIFITFWKHINRDHNFRDRQSLLRVNVTLHPRSQDNTEGYHDLQALGSRRAYSKQLIKNATFIPVNMEAEGTINNSDNTNTQNRTHLYGVSMNTRLKDLIDTFLSHIQNQEVDRSRHSSLLFTIGQQELDILNNESNLDRKIILLIKKYHEHLYFHKNRINNLIDPSNLERYMANMDQRVISVSNLDSLQNMDHLPEINLHEFIGWRSTLADGDLFNLEPQAEGDYIIIEGFHFYTDIEKSGIYDGFNLEQNSSIGLNNMIGAPSDPITYDLKQLNTYIKNNFFEGSTGDAISVISNIKLFLNNNFFTDCWRGSFSITGGFNSIFCNNLINQDSKLKILYNDQNLIASSPAYTGIESEHNDNTNDLGWTRDARMNLLLNNIYISGNFDFTFGIHTQVFISNLISDQSLSRMYFSSPGGFDENTIDVRICDTILTISEFGGLGSNNSSLITFERVGSFYGDQIIFKGRNNDFQKIAIERQTSSFDGNHNFVGIQIARRYLQLSRTNFDTSLNYNILFSSCYVTNELFVNTGQKIGFSSIAYGHPTQRTIEENQGLILINKTIFNKNLMVGFNFGDSGATTGPLCAKDFVVINKCYTPNKISNLISLDLIKNSIHYPKNDQCYFIINNIDVLAYFGNNTDFENPDESLVTLSKNYSNRNTPIYLEIKNTITSINSMIIFTENINETVFSYFQSFSTRAIYSYSDMIILTTSPIISGIRGEILYNQENILTLNLDNDIFAWICSSTGEMMDSRDEPDTIPNANWANNYIKI